MALNEKLPNVVLVAELKAGINKSIKFPLEADMHACVYQSSWHEIFIEAFHSRPQMWTCVLTLEAKPPKSTERLSSEDQECLYKIPSNSCGDIGGSRFSLLRVSESNEDNRLLAVASFWKDRHERERANSLRVLLELFNNLFEIKRFIPGHQSFSHQEKSQFCFDRLHLVHPRAVKTGEVSLN